MLLAVARYNLGLITMPLIEIVTEGIKGKHDVSKPKTLKGIKPVFSLQHGGHRQYQPNGIKCPVFIDGVDVWLKHCQWIWSNGVAWIRFNALLELKPGEATRIVMSETLKGRSRFSTEDSAMMTDLICRLNAMQLFCHEDRQFVYAIDNREVRPCNMTDR